MKIMRVGKFYEVVSERKILFKGANYEDARNYLAVNGVSDAVGDLSRGRVTIYSEYDEQGCEYIRNERRKIRRTFECSLVDTLKPKGSESKADALKELDQIIGE